MNFEVGGCTQGFIGRAQAQSSDAGLTAAFGICWTGLASFGDDQARAKVRARHVRLTFGWSSADLRLIS